MYIGLICTACRLPYEWHLVVAKGHVFHTTVARSLDEERHIKRRVRELTRTHGKQKEASY